MIQIIVIICVSEYSSECICMTLTELAEKYGEFIDNLPMDILMELTYNERNASDARVLHGHDLRKRKKRKPTAAMQK